jgi:hypothetical protein
MARWSQRYQRCSPIPLLGEWPTRSGWIGIVLISAGVYLASGGPLPVLITRRDDAPSRDPEAPGQLSSPLRAFEPVAAASATQLPDGIWIVQGRAIQGTRRCGDWLGSPDQGKVSCPAWSKGREGADTGWASRINVSQADGVAAIRIDIAAGSVYLRSCPSGTQSTSGPPPDFSEIEITRGLKRMPGASRAIRSGGQPCSPRARRSRRGPARS